MKKVLFALSLALFAAPVIAQDYYLTADKNKTPLKVKNFAGVNELLKASKKQDKYQVLFFDIGQSDAIYALVPASLKQEMSEDGIVLLDKANDTFGLETAVTALGIKAEADTFKADISNESKLLSEKPLNIGGKMTYELVFDMLDGTLSGAYFVAFNNKTIKIAFVSDKVNMPKYSAAVKDIIASIGLAVIQQEAAPVVVAEPEEKEALDITNFRTVAATPVSKKMSHVLFNVGDKDLTFDLASDIKPSLAEGRIVFAAPIKTKNVFFMEIPGAESKEYYNSVLAGFSQSMKLNTLPVQNIKVGNVNVRLSKKTALNMSADNYFFTKEGVPFVISFIGDSKDQPYFDKAAKAIITGIKPAAVTPAKI